MAWMPTCGISSGDTLTHTLMPKKPTTCRHVTCSPDVRFLRVRYQSFAAARRSRWRRWTPSASVRGPPPDPEPQALFLGPRKCLLPYTCIHTENISWNIPGIFELGPDNTPGAGIARAGEGGDRNFGMHLVPVSGGETEVEDRALASPGGDAAVLHCH